ncbi:MAG TPA: hypothetical protein VGL92_11095 [Acidimicrobiia bacterium]|jgi:hypothetical protein
MGRTALVTGSTDRVGEVSEALEKAGFTVTQSGGLPSDIEAACAALSPGSLDCYVQLPRQTPVSGPTLVERIHEFLSEGLLKRFEATSRVLPLLAPDACVVLVAGNIPGGATPDDRHARIDLLRVLARAILADCDKSDVRAVVVGTERSAEEIADLALHRGDERRRRQAQVAALSPEMPYEDWQREFLTLTAEEE